MTHSKIAARDKRRKARTRAINKARQGNKVYYVGRRMIG